MDNPDGKVIRYGYPRMEEIVNSEILYSYLYVMRKHPELKKQLWGGHMWNPGYFVATVSDRSLEQVERYIRQQKAR